VVLNSEIAGRNLELTGLQSERIIYLNTEYTEVAKGHTFAARASSVGVVRHSREQRKLLTTHPKIEAVLASAGPTVRKVSCEPARNTFLRISQKTFLCKLHLPKTAEYQIREWFSVKD